MILIPEQISYLRKQIIQTKENINSYKDYLTSKDITSGDYSSRAFIGDSVLDAQYGRERQIYRDTMNSLEAATYKRERNFEQIDIGTKFTIQFDGDEELDEIILVEGTQGLSFRDGFVSLNSPLGQNVIGKKENERFEYNVVTGTSPRDRRTIRGTVISINKDPNAYTSFIRENDKKERIGKKYKARRHELLIAGTPEAQSELEQYQTISISQRLILLIEADRIGKKANDRSAINRMTVVKRLLKEAKLAPRPTDGSIGVGSKFEIKINRDGVIETRQAEMINQAISDELDSDYIERISPLGYQLFGLRTGDSFTFREGNKVYNGCVSAVVQPKEEEEMLGFQYYR